MSLVKSVIRDWIFKRVLIANEDCGNVYDNLVAYELHLAIVMMQQLLISECID